MQIKAVATFLIISGAHINIFFVIKVNILVFIGWFRPPPIMLNIELRMIIIC